MHLANVYVCIVPLPVDLDNVVIYLAGPLIWALLQLFSDFLREFVVPPVAWIGRYLDAWLSIASRLISLLESFTPELLELVRNELRLRRLAVVAPPVNQFSRDLFHTVRAIFAGH
jgi:hypothetical protein